MEILVIGAGLMGSQIACEYALGGHAVEVLARGVAVVEERLDHAFRTATRHGLASDTQVAEGRARIHVSGSIESRVKDVDLVVESITEDLDAKLGILGPISERFESATIASNTSSLSITALGEGIGAPTRTVGTHYWNPPLLMPLVEVIQTETTDSGRVAAVIDGLIAISKQPILVRRDVPGFIWNRLQFALLREAIALVDSGVADAPTIDVVMRDGLAKRWRLTGPFQTAALGGAETFEAVAANLFPTLSDALNARGLRSITGAMQLEGFAELRDEGLAAELARRV